MDLELIEALLLKYDEGETTLEEERTLRDYFVNSDVPSHLAAEQARFLFMAEASTEVSSLKLEDITGSTNSGSKTIALPFGRSYFRVVMGVAATVSIIVVSLVVLRQSHQDAVGSKKTESEQLAYQQTKQALWLISTKLNRGNQHIVRLAKLNEAETRIAGSKTEK